MQSRLENAESAQLHPIAIGDMPLQTIEHAVRYCGGAFGVQISELHLNAANQINSFHIFSDFSNYNMFLWILQTAGPNSIRFFGIAIKNSRVAASRILLKMR
jgi:hypothetical protein